ncbi:MAG: 50S ribosomal protein L9 [Atopobiaceae bacterium]|jgi:large subunit ribosomal protein L9|nr:50S ribosomal protein L9 [Atopobiaceae bacterium]
MKVILLGELRGKGGEGDVVDVAQGYAENYLFPKRIALPATPGNIKQLDERRHNIEKREEKRVSEAQALKASLDEKTVRISAKVGEEGQLFGSVTAAMIADAVSEQLGITIDRKRIELNRAIKTAGTHEITIDLYRSISSKFFLAVGSAEDVAKADEAAAAEPEAEVESSEATAEESQDAAEAAVETAEE